MSWMRIFRVAALACATLASPVALSGPWLIARADVFDLSISDRLLLLPDGTVFHLATIRQQAIGQVYGPADTLVYDLGRRKLIVRPDSLPSDTILREPNLFPALGPALLDRVDVSSGTAIYSPGDDYFFASLTGFPYISPELDGNQRIVFVGDILDAYRGYQPGPNPLQPDADLDGVPDLFDNCTLSPNGPSNGPQAGPSQYDVDGDGYGNRCDADFNNDCIVNAVDLGVLRSDFFATGQTATDLNGDGLVNAVDLGILRTLFFGLPGPSGQTDACVGN